MYAFKSITIITFRLIVTEQLFMIMRDKTVIYFKLSVVIRKINFTIFGSNDETLILFILINCMVEQFFAIENTKSICPLTMLSSRFVVLSTVFQLHNWVMCDYKSFSCNIIFFIPD